jgi:hypothetical protein
MLEQKDGCLGEQSNVLLDALAAGMCGIAHIASPVVKPAIIAGLEQFRCELYITQCTCELPTREN